jgi:hypothetical protein
MGTQLGPLGEPVNPTFLAPDRNVFTGKPLPPPPPSAPGFTVDNHAMALRVGELESLADEIGLVADQLDCTGDIGPGGLSAAVAELTSQWRDGLHTMRDTIKSMADAVNAQGHNYVQAEEVEKSAFHQKFGT